MAFGFFLGQTQIKACKCSQHPLQVTFPIIFLAFWQFADFVFSGLLLQMSPVVAGSQRPSFHGASLCFHGWGRRRPGPLRAGWKVWSSWFPWNINFCSQIRALKGAVTQAEMRFCRAQLWPETWSCEPEGCKYALDFEGSCLVMRNVVLPLAVVSADSCTHNSVPEQ